MTHPRIALLIDGEEVHDTGQSVPVVNPADEAVLGQLPYVDHSLLGRAASATGAGFAQWRTTPARQRARALADAADILEAQLDENSRLLTLEQGKPLREAKAEWRATIDVLRWFAEEARRTYGRVIPDGPGTQHLVVSQPVGPVLALTPWNVPALAAGRKLAPALAAGCSVVLKGAAETPSAGYALVSALHAAGVPRRAVQLVFGEPAQVSEYLIGAPAIRKVSFTGSTRVGRIIAGLAAQGLKRSTLELGGHAPVLVFPDVDAQVAAREAAAWKFRSGGQICASPTRFLVHEAVLDEFTAAFAEAAAEIHVGDGLDPDTAMGPLITRQRLEDVDELVTDAVEHGASLLTGGPDPRTKGFFYRPTVLSGVSEDARIMREEPFGPVAPITSFTDYDDALAQANAVPVGLAGYVVTDSRRTARAAAEDLKVGVVGINDYNCSRCEVPFGGVKDTGWGQEGGLEGIEPYLVHKAVLNA
ncbi:NAD-dependent succinate-semialdehyde dehydrogenase [Streptomyces sulphureus]|uniref:NAD-dependent succinate-semialdehyde dehydrogenase n=1 Tax=Streptomyces sulphureus TaxID=47758 RepID=UPI00037DCFE1|nr:NAD-dependent succinate-semialdehyde dehydrogenase [Streptomyces sulphureus]